MILEIHKLQTDGCRTTPKLEIVINECNNTLGFFLPNLSSIVPNKGERNNSTAAEAAERNDRILTARSCGFDDDLVVVVVDDDDVVAVVR